MSTFFGEDIFLGNDKAIMLYEQVKDLPIYDYHCHLSCQEIFEDKKFFNLTELWLEGDHYKWRIMRAFGITEALITGSGSPYDKFCAFAKALPYFVGNPVYHWAHLELKKYFKINLPISEQNAEKIWEMTSLAMADGSFSARNLINKSNVKCIITTDEPCDSLIFHQKIAENNYDFTVLPCFRLDKTINIENVDFTQYISNLGLVANQKINSFEDIIAAISSRIDYFVDNGCVSTDCSLKSFPKPKLDLALVSLVVTKRLNRQEITKDEADLYKYCLLIQIGRICSQKNLIMQLHMGVIRNNNSALLHLCGLDAGGDSVGNATDIEAIRLYLDSLNNNFGLPKTIIYTLNESDYYPIATLLGNFQKDIFGKLQLGAAWWFNDHKDGIKKQLLTFATTGGIGLFTGMLTDSRSFTSYARHDYFRRILCSVIGSWIENGECPDDKAYLKGLLENICYYNAAKYFGGKK